jgi:hypothetical protein
MPLKKLPPQYEPYTNVQPTIRPQIQNRRRTLQTISELSSTDLIIPSFASSIPPERIQNLKHNASGLSRKTNGSAKRQSLPQYRASRSLQSSVAVPSTHRPAPQQSRSTPASIPTANENSHGKGYNAKRDRARSRHEQELADARLQQKNSIQKINTERSSLYSRPSMSSISLRPNQSHERLQIDQQQLLRNSQSMNGIPQVFELPQILGDVERCHFERDTEPSERTSTGSSSVRDNAIGRSRSGSSSTSYTSQELPSLRKESVKHQYKDAQQNQDLISFGESARSGNLRSRRSARTFSLPSCQSGDYIMTYHTGDSNSRSSLNTSSPSSTYVSSQRAREEALAALTASNDRQAIERSTSLPNSGISRVHFVNTNGYVRHASLSSHPTYPIPSQGPKRYYANLQQQARCQSAHTMSSTSQKSRSRSLHEGMYADLEKRTVPKRESLTQWKAERDEARASLVGNHRATIQERVRRANELEEAREKELISQGKRSQNSEAGCFGGLLTRMRNRRS